LQGAIAQLNYMGHYMGVWDLPVARDHKRSWIDGGMLADILANLAAGADCYIEAVHAMPKQGVSSSFQFGTGYGSIIGCLQALRYRIEFVPPTQWKKDLNLGRGSDKDAALHRARQLFPTAPLSLKKHEGRAEALLIAHWAYLKYRKDPK
jgi:hypothetical protein